MKCFYFVADVHLTPDESDLNRQFIAFLNTLNDKNAAALYILGDLFDVWLGDDANHYSEIIRALRALTKRRVMLLIQHGNRDFMLGRRFFKACCATWLPEAYVFTSNGQRWLLTHGDTLVADRHYQRYRRIIRHPLARLLLSVLPLSLRCKIAAKMRAASRGGVDRAYLDEARTVQMLNHHQCQYLIHGHLHRHGHWQWQQGDKRYQRWCLPAWHEHGGGYIAISRGEITIHANHSAVS